MLNKSKMILQQSSLENKKTICNSFISQAVVSSVFLFNLICFSFYNSCFCRILCLILKIMEGSKSSQYLSLLFWLNSLASMTKVFLLTWNPPLNIFVGILFPSGQFWSLLIQRSFRKRAHLKINDRTCMECCLKPK